MTSLRELARAEASAALAAGIADEPLFLSGGELLDPVEVHSRSGEAVGWVVPVSRGDELLGFVQTSGGGQFQRYASFGRRDREFTGCPAWRDWFDIDVVLARAGHLVDDDHSLGTPALGYHRNRDRLVWRVEATSRCGSPVQVCVTGLSAWVEAPG